VRNGTPVIDLSPVEQDILGDMAFDSHGVGELVGFIRSANPYFNDSDIFHKLRALLERWIGRGWLKVCDSHKRRAGPSTVGDLLLLLDRVGPDAMDVESDVELPEVGLTDQAFDDVEWLRRDG
jgi:hypothetical protein